MTEPKRKGVGGRPKGRKNNATLIREAELSKALKTCNGIMTLEAPNIALAMVARAKEGDVSAARLILDRVYPALRQADDRNGGKDVAIQINIVSTEEQRDAFDSKSSTAITISESTADGEFSEGEEGGEVFSGDAGQKRPQPH